MSSTSGEGNPTRIPGTPVPEDELLRAVQSLNVTVQRLAKSLEDYPKRAEIERNYASREDQKRARKQFIRFVAIALVFSFMFSFITIVGTISTCFLSGSARAGHAPGACNTFPGFRESTRQNRILLKQFNELVKAPVKNDRRLDRIEKKLGIKNPSH